MGLLVDDQWHDQWYETKSNDGRFERDAARFRSWITADGEPGPSGSGGFRAAAERYHLYVSLACPWAHRTLIYRRLKGLEDLVGVSVVKPEMLADGWEYDEPDPVNGVRFHHQLYTLATPDYSGRVTVPVLWDRQRHTIVSNESSEIIRMFGAAFDHLTGNTLDFYPEESRAEVDALNARIYETVNNGVYRCGFATTQAAYDEAFQALFETLDWLDERLASQRYLAGDRITEADWRLFTTLVRFDAVYHGHFKCNLRRIVDYPHLSGYLCELYQVPGVAGTVDMPHIKRHYYYSHRTINPTGIVPAGPLLDLERAHGRERLGNMTDTGRKAS